MTPALYHRIDGSGSGIPLLAGPSLGTGLAVWEPTVQALGRERRVVRWDLPGHGGSPADLLPHDGSADVADLGRLVLDLADALGLERFHYAGVSLSGAVGSWLLVHHPSRLASLTLVCTSARFGEPEPWRQRAAQVRADGTAALAASAPDRWFADRAFATTALARQLITDQRTVDPAGYAACCDALSRFDLREELKATDVPVLILAGRQDPALTADHARALADSLPDATLLEIPGAGHLAPAEQPARVVAAMRPHLADSEVVHESGTSSGMAVRRAVLGDAHVDRAVARTTPFTAPFQDLITRYAWGEIWTRPGLDRRTRSCITLTALVAGGHLEELAMHVRAARTNGLTEDEIGEVLLQTAIYCGVPAANAAFAVAQRVLSEGPIAFVQEIGTSSLTQPEGQQS